MGKAKAFLAIQSVLCILVVLLLSLAAIRVYRDGSARRDEDPTAPIYTREETAAAAVPGTIVLCIGIMVTLIGGILGIKDTAQDRPAAGDRTDMQVILQKRIPEDKLSKIRILLAVAAVACIIAGILNGSMEAVMIKAINICAECIGLG